MSRSNLPIFVGMQVQFQLRLEARRVRSRPSRDHLRDVVWLDFAAPHKHLVADVTVNGTSKISNVPVVGSSLPLPNILAMGAKHAKLDANPPKSSSLGTPSIPLMTITPMLLRTGAGWLLRRLTLFIAWPLWWLWDFPQAWVRRPLALCSLKVMPACMSFTAVYICPLPSTSRVCAS
jgi:hypothetical protein